jgi:hypothetical protein
MAIALWEKGMVEPVVIDRKADITNLRNHLKRLHGTKALTFEESTSSQWLYTELRDLVDELIVCDPIAVA